MPRKNKSTHFICTSYNPYPPRFDDEHGQALAYQQEIAPTTGRYHYQIAAEFKSEFTFKQAQKMLNVGNAHIEYMRGTVEENKAYCSKTATSVPLTYKLIGVFTPNTNANGRGDRTDLKTACEAMLSGGWDKVEDTMIVKFHRGLSFLQLVRMKPYRGPRECWWFYGPTGTNKSRYALEYLEDIGPTYTAPGRGGWFDGYSGEKCVLIDEFGPNQFALEEILKITAPYVPHKVPTKGGTVPFMAEYVIITSHFPPECFYEFGRMPEIYRRIQVCDFGDPYNAGG